MPTYTWNGSTDSDWTNPANWTSTNGGTHYPGFAAGDTALFDDSAGAFAHEVDPSATATIQPLAALNFNLINLAAQMTIGAGIVLGVGGTVTVYNSMSAGFAYSFITYQGWANVTFTNVYNAAPIGTTQGQGTITFHGGSSGSDMYAQTLFADGQFFATTNGSDQVHFYCDTVTFDTTSDAAQHAIFYGDVVFNGNSSVTTDVTFAGAGSTITWNAAPNGGFSRVDITASGVKILVYQDLELNCISGSATVYLKPTAGTLPSFRDDNGRLTAKNDPLDFVGVVPTNIKKNVVLFGVTGTLSGGAVPGSGWPPYWPPQ